MHLAKVVLFLMTFYDCGSIILSAIVPMFAAVNQGKQSMSSRISSQPAAFRRFPRDLSNSLSRRRRQNEAPKSYKIDYFIVDDQGNKHYRDEEADENGNVRGSYGYTDIKGLLRIVEYTADSKGFRANIQSNEPGLDGKKSPADVILNDSSDSDPYSDEEGTSGERRGTPKKKPYTQKNEAAAVGNLYNSELPKKTEEDDTYDK